MDPAGNAWRRDEQIPVLVTSSSAIGASSVTWTAAGMLADGGVATASASQAVASGPCPTGVTAAYCGTFTVDASLPELDGLSGNLAVTVTDGDALSSPVSVSAAVKVTRYRWAVTVGNSVKATPAVGTQGVVYVATADSASSGKVISLNSADGTLIYSSANVGQIVASPAVGAFDGANEWVYFGSASAPFFLTGLQGPAGTSTYSCASGAGIFGAVAIAPTTPLGTAFESVMAISNSSPVALLTARPPAAGAAQCDTTSAGGNTSFPGSVVTDGVSLYFGDSGGDVRAFTFSSHWNPIAIWSNNNYAAVGGTPISGLAINSSSVIGSVKSKGVFQLARSDGTLTGHAPSTGTPSDPGSVAIANGGAVYLGNGDDAAPVLIRVIPSTSIVTSAVPTHGPVTAAPALGKDGLVYTLSKAGALEVWDAALHSQWTAQLSSSGAFSASPNLDCSRDAAGGTAAHPGTLYAASEGGILYSIIVDSHGLDPSAPWPKYQHDARNTGNSTTGVVNCP